MKKTILRFGRYGASIGGLVFVISHFFLQNLDLGTLEIFGYISIFSSLLFVFFGIKHFRDHVNEGFIKFGKALLIGLAISAVVALAIAILDIFYVTVINPDFATEYLEYTLSERKTTLSAEEFKLKEAELREQVKVYDNPAFTGLFMFGLVFAYGIIISLISSLVLQRKPS